MQNSSVRRLSVLAMLAAAAVVLCVCLRFPLFASAPWLEYDAGDVPLIFAAFLYGPWWGLAVTAVVCVIQGFTVSAASGWIGIVMHLCATGALVVTAGLLYAARQNRPHWAMIFGALAAILLMIPLNLWLTPLYGTPVEAVRALLLPAILPFNAVKFGVNTLAAWLLYRPMEKYIRERKE